MTFPGLRPKTDNFLRLGPPPQLLICLFGGLQCGMHVIPIELWFPRSFPREAPLLFIVPATGASIRATGMVDATGRVIHPFLTGWRTDMAVTEVLRIVAGALAMDPPFYPGAGRPLYPGDRSSGTNPINFPPPTTGSIRSPIPPPAPTSTSAPPPLSPPMSSSSATSTSRPPANLTIPAGSKENLPELRRLLRERINVLFRKWQHELTMEGDRLVAEANQLGDRRKQQREGYEKIKDAIAQLETKVETVRRHKETIQQLVDGPEELSLVLDELVQPVGPIAQQLFDLYVKDAALGDVIFMLTKAFLDGKPPMPLLTFIKHLREVAREQFLVKDHLLRIRKEFPIIK